MKYYNLVFINHNDKDKNYLFQLPKNLLLKKGEKVFVETIQGECVGTAVSDSFIVDKYTAEQIIVGTGAYEPLKDVIGWAEKQDGYRCIDFRLASVPF